MSIDQDSQNSASYASRYLLSLHKNFPSLTSIDYRNTSKQTIRNKSKLVVSPDESHEQILSNCNTLCQELCNKLNLSDSNQISEIVRVLSLNLPHMLKESYQVKNTSVNGSDINKGPCYECYSVCYCISYICLS